ncbi:MAG: sialidase family protein [Planctomycetota bacterium]|nr:sialidase family protein [Planctomycetota bacterium]
MKFKYCFHVKVTAALLLCLGVGAQVSLAEWQPHQIKQGDGQGSHIRLPAQRQALKIPDAKRFLPFGLVQMDNGEIALLASREVPGFHPVIAFSSDDGDTWSKFHETPGPGRPMHLTYLGKGNVSYIVGKVRHFSSDYGRTWTKSFPVPLTKDDQTWHVEGNACVDHDANGMAVKVMESGWHLKLGKTYLDGMVAVFRYSLDGGRTWQGEVSPPQWQQCLTVGKKRFCGAGECALVRAKNGWLVAALRTGMPTLYFGKKKNDHLTGTGVSVSKDDGKTWSEQNVLYTAGRHHANLQRLPNGDLVMSLICRCDIRSGDHLDTHMRGADALISHDNGLTWNLDKRYTLDEYEYYDKSNWLDGKCGHIGAVVLDDGSIVTAYGKYHTAEAVLIKWRPQLRGKSK